MLLRHTFVLALLLLALLVRTATGSGGDGGGGVVVLPFGQAAQKLVDTTPPPARTTITVPNFRGDIVAKLPAGMTDVIVSLSVPDDTGIAPVFSLAHDTLRLDGSSLGEVFDAGIMRLEVLLVSPSGLGLLLVIDLAADDTATITVH